MPNEREERDVNIATAGYSLCALFRLKTEGFRGTVSTTERAVVETLSPGTLNETRSALPRADLANGYRIAPAGITSARPGITGKTVRLGTS